MVSERMFDLVTLELAVGGCTQSSITVRSWRMAVQSLTQTRIDPGFLAFLAQDLYF